MTGGHHLGRRGSIAHHTSPSTTLESAMMDTHFPILGLTAHSWAMPPSPKTHAVPVGEPIAPCGLVITFDERGSWPALAGRVCELCLILSESHES